MSDAAFANLTGEVVHRFDHRAMATTFTIYIFDEEHGYARQAARAAFDLIDDLEEQLSYFVPSSDVSQINRLKAGESVRVGPATLACIQTGLEVGRLTGGAFDLTVGALLSGRQPWDATPLGAELYQPRLGPVTVGMDLIAVNPELNAVAVLADNVEIDLGGIGKGYALDEAAQLLRDWGIARAMLSAGLSTMLPVGEPPAEGWRMRVIEPRNEKQVLAHFRTFDRAVSTSSWSPDQPHILDPTTGEPATHYLAAWSMAPSAAWADALSTAFLVMPPESIEALCRERPEVCGMLLSDQDGALSLAAFGSWQRLACELNDQSCEPAAEAGPTS